MKPIIGIIGRVELNTKPYIKVYDEYRTSIIKSGGIPIMILPPYKEKINEIKSFNDKEYENVDELIDLCDGFLFPGGTIWYNYEYEIYKKACNKNKGILAICLGMQMIASNNNLNNISRINSYIKHNSEYTYVHKIYLNESLLKKILNKDEIIVNSRHNDCVNKTNLIISSKSIDNIIESVELDNNVICVEWHPESLYDIDINSKKIFDWFINISKEN